MLKGERQQVIIDILAKEKKVIASDLSSRLSVSEDTIRRDLNELDKMGLARRVHSGALQVGPPVTDFSHRETVLTDTKIHLGHLAIPLLKEESVILIDGGTSNLSFVRQIPLEFNATIVTNSPHVAIALGHHQNIEIIMLGGTLYKESMVNIGYETIEAITNMRIDLYVLGVHNIDSNFGLSVPTIQEAQLKKKMAEVAAEIICFVVSEKLETISTHLYMSTNQITHLITNCNDQNILDRYKKRGISIIT